MAGNSSFSRNCRPAENIDFRFCRENGRLLRSASRQLDFICLLISSFSFSQLRFSYSSLQVFIPASMPFNWCLSHEFSPLDALPHASLAFSRRSTSLFLLSPDVILSFFLFHSLCSHDIKRRYFLLFSFTIFWKKKKGYFFHSFLTFRITSYVFTSVHQHARFILVEIIVNSFL